MSGVLFFLPLGANAEQQAFMIGCTVESVTATNAYSSRAAMLRDPSLVYVMIPNAGQNGVGLTLIPVFNGINAGSGDQFQPTTQLEAGFIFTRSEPEPMHDTKNTLRETEISTPLDFSSFSFLERMWQCRDGSCSIDTLLFTALCDDPRPL